MDYKFEIRTPDDQHGLLPDAPIFYKSVWLFALVCL